MFRNLHFVKILQCISLISIAPQSVRCDEGPITVSTVKSEYLLPEYNLSLLEKDTSTVTLDNDSDTFYVFLQRFPLRGTPFFHTEVVVCSRDKFTTADQTKLDSHVASITGTGVRPQLSSNSNSNNGPKFVQLSDSWWSTRDTPCVEMGYGGASCRKKCCSVPHGKDQVPYPLNARRAVISNANVHKKALFLYGTGTFSGEVAYQSLCNETNSKKCWSNWSGTDYRILKNNCNTFTSTVLSCVYGLSEKKPHLGVSDLVSVKCKCPHESMPDTLEED